MVFSYSTNGTVTFTTESHDAGELGLFALNTAEGKFAVGGVFNPGLSKFETNDSSAQFFYSSWVDVMKASTVEIHINKNKKQLTMTFLAGEKVVGTFVSMVPDGVKDFNRVTCFQWKVRSELSSFITFTEAFELISNNYQITMHLYLVKFEPEFCSVKCHQCLNGEINATRATIR